MSDPELRMARAVEPENLTVPVNTPTYRYLVCDLLTDQLWASVPFTNVTFDRRVSRAGGWKGSMRISNRAQALQADTISSNCGRLAVWVLRNKSLWWGGILWNAKAGISTKTYDTVDFQGATFESYADRNEIDTDWAVDSSKDMTHKVMDIWNTLQSDPQADIGVYANYANAANLAGTYLPVAFAESDRLSYAEMIEAYTDDPSAGIDYTISVYIDENGNRTKTLRTAGAFKDIPASAPPVISGYRIPSWNISRDTANMGTRFRAWVDAQVSNVGEETKPLSSAIYTAADLYAEGWPRLDVSERLDGTFTPNLGTWYANTYASLMKRRQSGIRDVVSYDVDLSTTGWHPNLIGQQVVIKHSKRDLWRPGETTVQYPVVAEFSAPERGNPERVTFTFDNTREVEA